MASPLTAKGKNCKAAFVVAWGANAASRSVGECGRRIPAVYWRDPPTPAWPFGRKTPDWPMEKTTLLWLWAALSITMCPQEMDGNLGHRASEVGKAKEEDRSPGRRDPPALA